MKRIIAMLLALVCCLSLFGCKKQAAPAPTQEPAEVTEEAPTEKPTEAPTEVSAEAPTEAPTQAPTIVTTKASTRKPITVMTKPSATTSTTAPTAVPTEAATETTAVPHTHTFGEWVLQADSTCVVEGREERRCSECGFAESQTLEKTPHELNDQNICRNCSWVEFDENADLVELGIVCNAWYDVGAVANCAWDMKLWNGKIYRAAGDYDKNSGSTVILAYDIASRRWEVTGTAADEAIHRFVEIDGTLYTPGIDPTEDWDLGNYYVLDGESWTKLRNLPNGIHNYDMVEFDGKIFAGLGVSAPNSPVVMSTDKGKTYNFVPLYKDGKQVDTTDMTYIRAYEYMVFNDQLYAYVTLDSSKEIYRFETDKMVWVGQSSGLVYNKRTNINYFNAKFQLGDRYFLVSNHLIAVKDFADLSTAGRAVLPQNEYVSDALMKDDLMYVLAYRQKDDGTYQTVIYRSKTGLTDSFTEVVQFDYAVPPTSFTFDGDYFYIGMGSKHAVHEKNGMVLRATPQK